MNALWLILLAPCAQGEPSGELRIARAPSRVFRAAASRTGEAAPAAAGGRRAAFHTSAADAPVAALRPILGAPAITGEHRVIIIDGQFMTFNQAAALMDPTLLRRAVENVAQFQDSGSYAASEPEIRSILEKEGVVAKPGRPKPKAEPKPAPPGWNGTFDSPLRAGVITSPFGVDRGDHRHTGLDIAAGSGTPILASAPGTVIHAAWTGGYGNLVIVRHGESVTTYYAHASAFKARKGDAVRQGQTVALVGSTGNSTGPHVHFEIRVGSTPTDPCKRLRRC